VILISSNMPLKKEQFFVSQDDLQKAVDVDDSQGRECPINMNFTESGYLSKDTGCSLHGATETSLAHSPFYYKKKDGTSYIIRVLGTKLQTYNTTTKLWADTASSPTFTAGAYMGYVVYENNLWMGNAVESIYKWDGTTFTAYASSPKGNNLEIFEDRLFVSGVTTEPLSLYYSKVADPTDFTVSSTAGGVVKPLGTDFIQTQENYYGQLLIFKKESIWKLTFVYDSVVALFVPKLELQSGNYGACSRKAVTWVENDIWFFTGREVRSIGYKDQQTGILGINNSVISEQIKETLYTIAQSDYSKVATFYHNRRYYLSVPLTSGGQNDTTFVCHLLYKSTWTKYESRIKSSTTDYMAIDGIVYSAKSVTPYGVIKWDETLLNDNSVAIAAEVTFKKIEDNDFNKYVLYRYLDLMFKNLEGRMNITVLYDAYDLRSTKTKTFYIGQPLEDMNSTTGEVVFGQNLYGDGFGEDLTGSPFEKKRVSFLVKAQTITIRIGNSSLSETFTVCQYILSGFKEPRKLAKPANIISMR
jgi:hypothetical protein